MRVRLKRHVIQPAHHLDVNFMGAAQFFQMPVFSEAVGGIFGFIINQKARFDIDKERRRVRCCRSDNARSKLFDSGIETLRHET